MTNELDEAVRRLCLAFPQTERVLSHGSSNFKILAGKTFATYAVNHHGDGRIALWLNMADGVQDAHVRAEPQQFFIPPYVGPRGWLGVRLDNGIAWKRVGELVRAAFENTAPPRIKILLGKTPAIPPPKRRITVEDVDPKNTPRGKLILGSMRKVCLGLPDTSEAVQFGQPVWRAGKKVFAQAYYYEARWRAAFWVGVHAQAFMTTDTRYEIPPYMGHNGWIALDVSKHLAEDELRSLALESYRHFALKRMLARLDPDAAPAPSAARRANTPRRKRT